MYRYHKSFVVHLDGMHGFPLLFGEANRGQHLPDGAQLVYNGLDLRFGKGKVKDVCVLLLIFNCF